MRNDSGWPRGRLSGLSVGVPGAARGNEFQERTQIGRAILTTPETTATGPSGRAVRLAASATRLFIIFFAIIFGAEAAVMMLLEFIIPPGTNKLLVAVLDPLCLTLFAAPILVPLMVRYHRKVL